MESEQITILNVEDNEANRYLRTRILRRAGFAVREASSGTLALQCIAEEQPMIVLLDVKLPDVDGFEICRRIKNNPATTSIIVVQISAAFVGSDDKVRGLEGGADGYLTDPMSSDELVATINAFARLYRAEAKLARANVELERQAKELRRSNKELEQFASVVSHDLQEPLRMITLYAQLLSRRYQGKLSAEEDEYFEYILEGTNRLQDLILNLLEYSRVQLRGNSFLATDCEEVFAQALRALSVSIEETGAVVTSDPLPTVCADRTQLGQLFQNLLSNALKFHGPRPPQIHVTAKPDGQEWLFSIQDQGIGLDPQFAERIFVIFQRLHTRKEYPGTGLGLALCKKIVERHGGRIWVNSQPGNGATFFFTLPIGPPYET
jgi:light-regulated signal transduction histidine kinase (bacteriophytochrome)